MASQKLTNSERDFIVKRIALSIDKNIQEVLDHYGKTVADPFLLRQIPQEIRDFEKKFPYMINKQNRLYYYYLKTNAKYEVIEIPVKYLYKDLFKGEKWIEPFFSELKQLASTQELIKTIEDLKVKRDSIKGKTRCILESINTTKQLKEQFPEAYNIYLSQYTEEVSEKNNNLCDSVENLRAELSKNQIIWHQSK